MELLRHIFLLFLSSYIIWKVCDSFQMASMFLGRKMPTGTRGATLNAIGSSFPEFLTSFIAIFGYTQNDGAMFGISNTTGSVIYNITMIPFFVILSCYFFKNLHKVSFNKVILIRDGLFLIGIQILLMFILTKGKITFFDSLSLVVLYIIYLVLIFYYPKKTITEELEEKCENYCSKVSKSYLKAFCDVDLFSLCFRHHKEQNHKNSTIVLILSIAIFYFTCDILVSSSYALGEILNVPSFLVAMTVTAAATSVPDTVLSIKDAKIDEFDEAMTNIFGSNIFNISFCIGFPILIYNIINGTDLILGTSSIDSINFLKNLTIFLIIFVVCLFSFGKKYLFTKALLLLISYCVFLFYIGIEVQNFRTPPQTIETNIQSEIKK